MLLALLAIILSLGAVNALIPLLVILILIVAAAGSTRGYSIFNFFGIATLAGISPGGKSSIAGKQSRHYEIEPYCDCYQHAAKMARRQQGPEDHARRKEYGYCRIHKE